MPTPPPTGPLVTRDDIAAQLRLLGVQAGETLLVHSSLSSLGWVNGGSVAVVRGLLDALGPEGTLVVPTQTGDLSDPARRAAQRPSADLLRGGRPARGGGDRGARSRLPARRAQPAGEAGGHGRPGPAARRR